MTCEEVTEFLLDYLSGDLPRAVRTTFEAHLAVCRDCRNYLDSYRKAIAISRQTKGAEIEEVPEGLVAAIMSAAQSADCWLSFFHINSVIPQRRDSHPTAAALSRS